MKDAYSLILSAIDNGIYRPGDRLVESELAERFGVSRTPVREALQRLETQSMLKRDGRSLIVATLDHNQLAELYTCLLYTSPSPRDRTRSRMPSSA